MAGGKSLAVALGIGLFALACLADTPQLILNGGFEDGEGEKAAAWGVWPPAGKHPGVSSLRDASVRKSGAFSGRLCVTSPEFEGICTWHHPNIPVRPGQECVLRFAVKAKDVQARCGVDIQFRADEKKIVGSTGAPVLKGTFDWQEQEHRFRIPDGVSFIAVIPYLSGTGTVWFDDVRLFGVPSLEAGVAQQPPKMDGDLSDPCWTEKNRASGFLTTTGDAPQRETDAWIACDAGHIYAAFRCRLKPGDALTANVKERDGQVWLDDDVELFLNPKGDYADYIQFVVNPLGTRYESQRTNAGWNAEWEAKTKVSPEEWTAEISIPISQVPVDFSVSDEWGANFCRSDKVAKEASSWSCVFGGFHSPERFGLVKHISCDLAPYHLAAARKALDAAAAGLEECRKGLAFADAPEALVGPPTKAQADIVAATREIESLLQHPKQVTNEQWRGLAARFEKIRALIEEFRGQSLRLRVFSFWKGKGIPSPAWGAAVAGPMCKVFRDGHDYSAMVSETVALSAARGECESFQVVAIPLTGDIKGCSVTATDLQGPGLIPASAISIRVVDYIKTGEPKYKTRFVGEWPDPLLPLKPMDVPLSQVQPYWVTVKVPFDAQPGLYRGMVSVESGSACRISLELTVRDFEIPKQGHLATPFGARAASIAKWYYGESAREERLSPEAWRRWCEFLLDYRLSPTSVGYSFEKRILKDDGSCDWDWTVVDGVMGAIAERVPLHSLNMARIGWLMWRGLKGGQIRTVDEGRESPRAGRVTFPKTEQWSSVERPVYADVLARKGMTGISFWIKAGDPSLAEERVDVYLNAPPRRFAAGIQVGPAEWHKVDLPLSAFHGNRGQGAMTLQDVAEVSTFQLVIARKKKPVSFLMDDIAAATAQGTVVIDDFDAGGLKKDLADDMGAKYRHWQERGWLDLGHVYGYDEAAPDDYPAVVEAYKAAVEVIPGAPIMQTYYTNKKPKELVGLVKTWCPLTANYDEEFCEERRNAGEDIWLYVCCGPAPPHGNFFIDQDAIDHRILFWQTWQKNAVGFLYWQTVYWYGLMPKKEGDATWPQAPWDQTQVATYREFKVNGDGWLIYPGPGVEPYPSVRLENIRDGIEDYEYLWLLRDAVKKAKGAGRSDALVAEAEKLLTVGDDISKTFTDFTKDPEVIQKRRNRIGEMIEKLK